MQLSDEHNKVVAAFCGSKEELIEKANALKYENPRFENCTVNISELPVIGEEHEIKGLRFRCTNVSEKRGYVGFHLIGVAENL